MTTTTITTMTTATITTMTQSHDLDHGFTGDPINFSLKIDCSGRAKWISKWRAHGTLTPLLADQKNFWIPDALEWLKHLHFDLGGNLLIVSALKVLLSSLCFPFFFLRRKKGGWLWPPGPLVSPGLLLRYDIKKMQNSNLSLFDPCFVDSKILDFDIGKIVKEN